MPNTGSLPNLFAKLRCDPGIPGARDADLEAGCALTGWAAQGVLLLNCCLTVPEGAPDGHRGVGWTWLVQQILWHLAPRPDIAWLMCGSRPSGRVLRGLSDQALVLRTGHPSQLVNFDVNRPFSRINEFLSHDRRVDWLRLA